MSEVVTSENRDQHRYEAYLDGELAGFVEYQEAKDLRVLTHTEVDEAHEGKGVGGVLARAALDDIRERGIKALLICPFIIAWVRKHPDYLDVIYGVPPSKVTD